MNPFRRPRELWREKRKKRGRENLETVNLQRADLTQCLKEKGSRNEERKMVRGDL